MAQLNGKIVGHFLFSRFPLSSERNGGYINKTENTIAMLAPVAVHADYFHQGVGSTMITLGISKVKKMGFKGITVMSTYLFRFCNESRCQST